MADHLSNMLLCPSKTAVSNLAAEGISQNVHLVGDVMLDVLNWAKQRVGANQPAILERFELSKQGYLLATVHRSENTDEAARLALTDSGGLQKEAYWLGVPCLTLRNETEWVETVEAGWNVLVGSDLSKIVDAVNSFSPPDSHPVLYGDGAAAAKCVDLLGIGPEPMALAERAEYAN